MDQESSIDFGNLLMESDEEFDESDIAPLMGSDEEFAELDIPEYAAVVSTGVENDVSALLGGLRVDTDDESQDSESQDDESQLDSIDSDEWSNSIRPLSSFLFESDASLCDLDLDPPSQPVDFYRLFLNDDLIAGILLETNRYGSANSFSFEEVDYDDFLKFIGLCLHMGIVRLPALRNYWSSKKIYGSNALCGATMTRARFEAILGNLHFCNNDSRDPNDRLFKIRMILDSFNSTAFSACNPGQCLTIDESIIPFRGRLFFKQYIPNKRHKFGVKLFKLCSKGGYTWKIEVYSGKLNDKCGSVAETIVMKLMDGLLDCGRRVYCDNWYSSVSLAKKLLDRRTDFVGTFRRNRRGFPKDVTQRTLRRGEMVASQHRDGITVIQWRDKRPVFCMSTCHGDDIDDRNVPLIVKDYNNCMHFVDSSDQMSAYYPFVRRTSKWYVRFFFHIMLQTALVNSWALFCSRTAKVSFLDFKCKVAESLLGLDGTETSSRRNRWTRRVLERVDGPAAQTRRNCSACYKTMASNWGRALAKKKVKRVNTRCSRCEKFFCLNCFNTVHVRC